MLTSTATIVIPAANNEIIYSLYTKNITRTHFLNHPPYCNHQREWLYVMQIDRVYLLHGSALFARENKFAV